jgi:succinyl-CoA synthetase beta subunit
MRLYEYEGKRLLTEYEISVPRWMLWVDEQSTLEYPVMVKAQVLEGGRGKRGGVVEADGLEATRRAAEAMLRGDRSLPPADAVLVEQRLDIERELYVALLLDRDSRAPVLLASPEGGVDIEEETSERLFRAELDSRHGIGRTIPGQVAVALGLPSEAEGRLATLLTSLWYLFREQDCLLVEINPLVVTVGHDFVAADARVVLDDAAAHRHPEWPPAREGTAFERRCAEFGAAATELDGDVAIITSGAGLALATLDTLAAANGTARCVVDLGGSVFSGHGTLAEIVGAAWRLRPRVLLFNFFLQLARCDAIAGEIASACSTYGIDCPVSIRLRGRNALEARQILEPLKCHITGELSDAVAWAIEGG